MFMEDNQLHCGQAFHTTTTVVVYFFYLYIYSYVLFYFFDFANLNQKKTENIFFLHQIIIFHCFSSVFFFYHITC